MVLELVRELELAGFDATGVGRDERAAATHVLLVPKRPRLFGGYDATEARLPGEDAISWDRIDLLERSPHDTRKCLWDFVDLAIDFNSDRLLRFVSEWGLLDFGEDLDIRDIQRQGDSDLIEWESAAQSTLYLLQLVTYTESYELIDEATLESLARRESWNYTEEFGIDTQAIMEEAMKDLDTANLQRELKSATNDAVIQHWRSMKRSGRGLEVQRRLASRVLTGWMARPDWDAVWDDGGRRIETAAYGVREIVGSHLFSIFGSQHIDVFTCSICSRPFEFAQSEGRRRPGGNRRRFCADECRASAKRKDNLASWHRNKSRWTKPPATRGGLEMSREQQKKEGDEDG